MKEQTPPDRSKDKPRIYTVPAGKPFLDHLARAILDGNLPSPGGAPPDTLGLAGVTLLMPTRRATRALQEAFLEVSGGRAMLLPAIRPIAEGDEELSLLAHGAGLVAAGSSPAGIPPAISELHRRLALTMLVERWSKLERDKKGASDALDMEPYAAAGASTPAQAAQLAKELGQLMDMVETEGASFDRLTDLVPETYAEHWQKTLGFLRIVTEYWPAYLAEQTLIPPAERRNRLIEAEAVRLASLPPAGPMIVAGVTGSIPATVGLMKAVLSLPNGAIVLPALDTALDEESWQRIVPDHPEHPQFGLKKLLDGLGLTRADVAVLPGAEPDGIGMARQQVISEALRPSATTGLWHAFTRATSAETMSRALDGVSLIEAPGAQDEAEAVALILRQAAETPGLTAALVSPDRLLARRVAVRLESWGIRVDDSAGRPFAKTVPGAFLNLVIEAIAKDFAPAATMALLKHPLTRLGLDPFSVRRAARALEIAVFRAPYLGVGIDGVDEALERAARDVKAGSGNRRHGAVRRLWPADWDAARDLVQRLRAAAAPLAKLFADPAPQSLRAFAAAHSAAAEGIAALPEGSSDADKTAELWRGEAGETAHTFFQGLADETLPELMISRHDYPDLYRSLLGAENVRPRVPVHPRLSIWGPFEARLQQPDIVILGSLNDGTWPENADPGPWLNRPMRQGLGLPSPEEKTGYAAHDFATLLGAPCVVLTRAEKVNGVPAVPSRWLLRLEALLAGMGLDNALEPKVPWLGWARHRDHVTAPQSIARPEPRPSVDLRPRKMSVSEVETWISNPYAIFARKILALEPLDALGLPPSPSLRGSIIHEALSRFARAYPDNLPANAEAELVRLAAGVLDEYAAHPRVAAFWVPRFRRFAAWFAETEPARRAAGGTVVAETSGRLVFEAPGGPFELTARADRIDVTPDGLVVTDYKTGAIPAGSAVADGIAPQLPLEAAIALGLEDKAGFTGVKSGPVTSLRYIRASGAEPPGEEKAVKCDDIAALARAQLDGLKRLVARFDDVATPYEPVRRGRFKYDYDEFAHLARVAEWGAARGGDGET